MTFTSVFVIFLILANKDLTRKNGFVLVNGLRRNIISPSRKGMVAGRTATTGRKQRDRRKWDQTVKP